MKNNNSLSSDNKLNMISILYMLMAIFYLFVILLVLFSSGSIRQLILENFISLLIPLLIPLLLSFIGLRRFKLEINSQHIKMYSNCIFMSNFSDDFNEKLIFKKDDFDSNQEHISFLGLKRNLVVFYKSKGKLIKKKINISFLSSKERTNLHNQLFEN